MKVNSINRQVRSQQHREAESSGPGGRTGSPFFRDIGGKGKVSQRNLQTDRPGFLGGKEERKEFQEGTCPFEHWGGAREEEKHTCSRSAHYKGGGCTCLCYLSNVTLWQPSLEASLESENSTCHGIQAPEESVYRSIDRILIQPVSQAAGIPESAMKMKIEV